MDRGQTSKHQVNHRPSVHSPCKQPGHYGAPPFWSLERTPNSSSSSSPSQSRPLSTPTYYYVACQGAMLLQPRIPGTRYGMVWYGKKQTLAAARCLCLDSRYNQPRRESPFSVSGAGECSESSDGALEQRSGSTWMMGRGKDCFFLSMYLSLMSGMEYAECSDTLAAAHHTRSNATNCNNNTTKEAIGTWPDRRRTLSISSISFPCQRYSPG